MIKYIKILICFIVMFKLVIAEVLAPDISFIDLPLSAQSGSLGNTYLSDVGNPTNLLQNPASIWFGDRINTNRKFVKNIFFKSSITNFELIDGNQNFNLMGSIQYGKYFTFGAGYVEHNQKEINQYDENANYLGEFDFKEYASILGLATEFSGINLGISGGVINYLFNGLNQSSNESSIGYAAIGLLINDRYVDKNNWNNKFLKNVIPQYFSLHATTKNIFYKDSSKNSMYKTIVGFKGNYYADLNKLHLLSVLLDYNSNNGISDDVYSLGFQYTINISGSNNFLSFNLGLKDINSIDQITYGVEYKNLNKYIDFSIAFANLNTPWNEEYSIITFKIFYDKK